MRTRAGGVGVCQRRWTGDRRAAAVAWRTYEKVAGGWDWIDERLAAAGTTISGDLWVVDARNQRGWRLRRPQTIILHEVVPVHVTLGGDRIRAQLYAAEPHLVIGGWLRLVLLVTPSGAPGTPTGPRPGLDEVAVRALGAATVGLIEQPFDAAGVIDIDVPVRAFGRDQPLVAICRRWPPQLRRISVVVPEVEQAPETWVSSLERTT